MITTTNKVAVKSIELSNEQLEQIRSEGWDIFSIDGGDEEFQIQKCDEADIFEDDDDAWKHIIDKASKGSNLHKHVLSYFKLNFLEEFSLYTKDAKNLPLDI